jgi:hypothetical protein
MFRFQWISRPARQISPPSREGLSEAEKLQGSAARAGLAASPSIALAVGYSPFILSRGAAAVDLASVGLDDRVKELEVELATLSTDMWAAQKRLKKEDFGFNWLEDISDEKWDRNRREEVDLVF